MNVVSGEVAGMAAGPRNPTGPFACKSIESLQAEAGSHGLSRTLGPMHLVLFGVGCILGAGIYVLPGTAAANFAGPAVMISFVLAGTACALTALCYAELASTVPVSGSSYSYCYASLGEVFAWGLGWILMLEYTLASSTLAVGFSSYLTSLLRDFGVVVPPVLSTPLVGSGGGFALNAVAAIAIAAVTGVLCAGVRQSAGVNAFLVVVKVAVIVVVIAVGASAIDPGLWTPFIPPHEGEFAFGWPGIVRAASILFFAYLGFETVSTAASESRNPQHDMPVGILGALFVCTVLYLAVAAVLTGVVPYRELGVADPVALAVDRMGRPGVAVFVKLGALMGLASVLLVNAYGQSRITFPMSRDGMLPSLFSHVHERFRTPHRGIMALGIVSAVCAAFFPIAMLADLVSLGAGLAFATVCFCTMWLRSRRPDLPRPFRVPLGGFRIGRAWIGYIPATALVLCIAMILPVLIDIGFQAASGKPLMAVFLGVYVAVGAFLYAGYGRRNSALTRGGGAP
jgi:APA family basic amino acid/polyamine antiporter